MEVNPKIGFSAQISLSQFYTNFDPVLCQIVSNGQYMYMYLSLM